MTSPCTNRTIDKSHGLTSSKSVCQPYEHHMTDMSMRYGCRAFDLFLRAGWPASSEQQTWRRPVFGKLHGKFKIAITDCNSSFQSTLMGNERVGALVNWFDHLVHWCLQAAILALAGGKGKEICMDRCCSAATHSEYLCTIAPA